MLLLAAGAQSADWQSSICREPQFCSQLADMLGSGNAAATHTWPAAEVLLYLLEPKRAGPQ